MSETLRAEADAAAGTFAPDDPLDERHLLEITAQISTLCDQSRCLDAYALGRQHLGQALANWPGIGGQLAAAELAPRLGGYQLGKVLLFRLARRSPDHPEVIYRTTWQSISRRPLARLWLSIRDQHLASDDPALAARWLALKGMVLAGMRDFDRSFELIDQSLQQCPDDPRLHLARARACRASDDLPGAIRACRDALEIVTHHGPAVQYLTDYLLQSGLVDEATDVITRAVKASQEGHLRLQLAEMYLHRKQFGNAVALNKDLERYFPLADPMRRGRPKPGSLLASIAAMRSDLAYHAGQYPASAKWGSLASDPFHDAVIANLKDNYKSGRRVQLDVPFVLQKQVTCAPATLTMLSRFWNLDVDQDDVVDEICYDGTAPVKIRRWAEDNGMETREFRVTSQAAQQLLDAGIPFALSTVDPGMGHIQVVCGYDWIRGVLLIQDPSLWHVREVLTTEILDTYRAFGPRGLVLVPRGQADRLSGIELPDCQQFDRQYAIEAALEAHDRPTAASILKMMQDQSPDNWMTLWAKMDLANYDSNAPVQLETIAKLRSLYPDDDVIWLWENRLLTMLDRPDTMIARLRDAIDQRRALGSTRIHLLDMLEDDAYREEREELLRAVLRDEPTSSAGLSAEANRLWRAGQHQDALELFRLAATSSELDESHAKTYLVAAARLQQQQEVLQVLEQRFRIHGDSSGGPAMTYAWALECALEPTKAAGIIRQAIDRRPQDGTLLCQAAPALGRLESPQVGLELLESATIPLPQQEAWRARAILATCDGRLEDALSAYREMEKLQPLNPELIDQIAGLQVELSGLDDAIDYLAGLSDRFPYCRSLLASTATLLHSAARFSDAIGYIDRILQSCYTDAWAWRERSLICKRFGWHQQALEDAEQAVACDESAASYTVRGDAQVKLDRIHLAKEDFRRAVELDCDYGAAIHSWMLNCRDERERGEALEVIYEQLIQQRTDGEGLAAYYAFASAIVDPDELGDQLTDICRSRQDSYAAYVLLANHYRNFRRLEDAGQVLLGIEDRFGMRAGFWQELGDVYRDLERDDLAQQAYENGIRISPHDSVLARSLADLYQAADRSDDAIALLRRALRGSPSDPSLLVALAECMEDKSESLKLVRKAAMRTPTSSSLWQLLLRLCQDLGRESEAVEAARALVAARPNDVHAHVRLAEVLHREDQCEESLAVIAQAMELDRRLPDVHALFAQRLFQRKYYDQALDACSPPEVDPYDAHQLDLLAAKVLYFSGRQNDACQRLRDALYRDPTDLEHWVQLADWCEEVDNRRWYDEAARTLVQRAPHLSISHCYYHTTMIRENRRGRAKQHLEYAVEIDPKCEYAVQQLIHLRYQDHEIEEAEAFLDRHATTISAQPLAIGRLLIAAYTHDAPAFVSTLAELPEDGDDLSQIAIASVACRDLDIEQEPDIATLLSRCIFKGRPNKAIGFAWAHFFCHPEFVDDSIADFHRLRHSDARNTAGAMILNMLKSIGDVDDPEVRSCACKETHRILKRLGNQIYKDACLWSHALWTLIGLDQHKQAVAIAKCFQRVPNRDVDDLVAAMIAALYHHDLKMTSKLLRDAEAMGPSKMTENGRLMRAAYAVHCGSDAELAAFICAVDKNEVEGPFLRLATLLGVGLDGIQSRDETGLIQQWKVDFVDKNDDDDPIDQRIFQMLRSRIALAAGDKRKAKRLRKSKYCRQAIEA